MKKKLFCEHSWESIDISRKEMMIQQTHESLIQFSMDILKEWIDVTNEKEYKGLKNLLFILWKNIHIPDTYDENNQEIKDKIFLYADNKLFVYENSWWIVDFILWKKSIGFFDKDGFVKEEWVSRKRFWNTETISIQGIPVRNPVRNDTINVTSRFWNRKDPLIWREAFHSGLDIKLNEWSELQATWDGIITKAGKYWDYGLFVEISHNYGYSTRYAHLSEIHVQEWDKVIGGTIIGKSWNSWRSTWPHLHYEIIRHEKSMNPEEYLCIGQLPEIKDILKTIDSIRK